MSRRCCCRVCEIVSDDFNRADSTNLGGNWNEVTGDSEIVGNELVIPAGGIVITTATHPVSSYTGAAFITMPDQTLGQKRRVLIQVNATGTAYMFAEYEHGSPGALRVGDQSGIFHELPVTADPGNRLSVCRGKSGIWGDVEVSGVIAWDCQPSAGSGPWRSGVMNAGAGDARFDDSLWQEHVYTLNGCTECACICDDECVGKALTLVIGASGICSCLDGTTVTLNWKQGSLPEWEWEGTVNLQNWNCEGGFGDVTFTLRCGEGGGWALTVVGDIGTCFAGAPVTLFPVTVGYSCNPLILEFGPWGCDQSEDPEDHCGWAVRVTYP